MRCLIIEKLKVIELFAGIGAWSKSLRNLGINYEVVEAIEYESRIIEAYNLIHDTSFIAKDITKINEKEIPDCDLICYSPPCVTFSRAGNQEGFNDERGILFFDSLRIIKEKMPKYAIMENVSSLAQKKFKYEFTVMLNELEQIGYKNYWKVINAKHLGAAQSRNRVFILSVREDVGLDFKFPEHIKSNLRMSHLLDDVVDLKYYLDRDLTQKLVENIDILDNPTDSHKIMTYNAKLPVRVRKYPVDVEKLKTLLKNSKKQSGLSNKQIAKTLDKPQTLVEHWFRSDNCFSIPDENAWFPLKELIGIDTAEFDECVCTFIEKDGEYDLANRIYDSRGLCCTLTATTQPKVLHNGVIRTITPKEAMLLMGFDKGDYDKIKNKVLESTIYKVSGNSIVTNVCEELFKELFKE